MLNVEERGILSSQLVPAALGSWLEKCQVVALETLIVVTMLQSSIFIKRYDAHAPFTPCQSSPRSPHAKRR